MSAALYIGVMSGTSMDGIDAVLADLSSPTPKVLEFTSLELPDSLIQQLLRLQHPSHNELHTSQILAVELAHLYAQACQPWLNSRWADSIRAIGVHGQTIRHEPKQSYTLQLNAPAVIAELCSKDVIADFRSRDIAAGGQGAPLVPIVHQALFAHPHKKRIILNLGGIANISILHPSQPVWGFDTGPANILLDAWIQRHQQLRYDHHGEWAASAQADDELLALLLSEPWLQMAPPKSTGRDLFNLGWLEQKLDLLDRDLSTGEVQATLLAFSAHSVSAAIRQYAPCTEEIIVCGGGAQNLALLKALSQHSGLVVRSTKELGLDPQHIEALAFAWLAYAHVQRIPASLPSVTGAKHARVLGACYPA